MTDQDTAKALLAHRTEGFSIRRIIRKSARRYFLSILAALALLAGPAATQASSVLINLTAADTRGPGYLTVAPARQALPPTSNVNAVPGSTFANFVTVGVGDDQEMCVYAYRATGTIFDTTGWWVPA